MEEQQNNLEDLIILPHKDSHLEQDEEYFYMKDNKEEKIPFHFYEKIYSIPGLYEVLFHKKLKCQSPTMMTNLFLNHIGIKEEIRLLDFGAGGGMVGEKFQNAINPDLLIGLDILEGAKKAAFRDRSEVYDNYFIGNLDNSNPALIQQLHSYKFNLLVSVAALGFGHISPACFINAFNLIENGGWIVFNLRDKFLTNNDLSGFHQTINDLTQGKMEMIAQERYLHRYTLDGKEIYYIGIVGRKITDMELKNNL